MIKKCKRGGMRIYYDIYIHPSTFFLKLKGGSNNWVSCDTPPPREIDRSGWNIFTVLLAASGKLPMN